MALYKRIVLYLGQPVTYLQNTSDKLLLALTVTLYTSFFLIVFQPFGVNNYDPTHSLGPEFVLGVLGFGIISGLAISIYQWVLAPLIFRGCTAFIFITKEVLGLTFLASMIFLFYNLLGDFHDLSWLSYLGFIRDVSLMSIIPWGVLILYFRYRMVKEEYALHTKAVDQQIIWFYGNHGKEELGLNIDQLLFIAAQDNYVAIHYLYKGRPTKKLLRTTIKSVEKQLERLDVVRCHRSYMVNKRRIESIKGSWARMILALEMVETPIPVSRSYVSSFRKPGG